MTYVLMAIFAVGVVFLDQWTKYWTVQNISPWFCADMEACKEHITALVENHLLPSGVSLPQSLPGIKGVFSLIQVHNPGAAWSSFPGQIWLFALIFAVFTAAIIWVYCKKALPFSKFEWFCIAAIYGGGLGNMIDRLRLGYVIDMIETQFINFPVFNVADSFITCGCIALMVSLIFFNKAFWKDEKK